jgi:dTDP-4-dehydrorhamnose reductase
VSAPLLVTGGTGYLGSELLRAAGTGVAATHLSSAPDPRVGVTWLQLDVRDGQAVDAAVDALRPAAVIHTAYRMNAPAVRETNVTGSANVAVAAARAGARLIHLSSDLVFDGKSSLPYTESDPPNPIGGYGQSKLEAERSVLAAHPRALVVRTSLMVGGAEPGRQERTVLEAARGEADTTFFEDELRSPVLVSDLAVALLELAARDESGVLHVAGPDAMSRYELACLVARAHGISPERLRRGRVAESGLERPAYCVLDSGRARGLLTSPLRGPRQLAQAGDRR